jgi:uncharacterized membrane protein YeaQ/YmgE (transglycosylase-associated protein family)
MPEVDQLLTWALVGVLAGGAAGSLVRRKLYFTEILIAGLLGAIVGGLVINAIGVNLPDERISFTVGDLITAFIGAAIVIGFAEIVIGTRRKRRK